MLCRLAVTHPVTRRPQGSPPFDGAPQNLRESACTAERCARRAQALRSAPAYRTCVYTIQRARSNVESIPTSRPCASTTGR